MPNAEIITIGTEILLGEIVDTNAAYLARALREAGINLYWKTTVGDNTERIAKAIRQGLVRSDIVLTTGGLGPTVDDPTRAAVALAVGVELEYRAALWEQIQARFQRYGRQPTENNRRQAYIPKGAIAIENPVGTAPVFIFETGGRAIIALPGVPREMEHLMQQAVLPYLRAHFDLKGVIKARLLHTAGVGESQIDDRIADLELLHNPTIGLAAHSGQVDVRITARADSEADADAMIAEIESVVRERLGSWIYGADGQTLEKMALDALAERAWKLVVVEAGLRGELARRLASTAGPFTSAEVLPLPVDAEQLFNLTTSYRQARQAQVGLGVAVQPGQDRQEVHLVLVTPGAQERQSRPFGGPPGYAARWAVNHSLDMIRNLLSAPSP